jgi:hypothetical protein
LAEQSQHLSYAQIRIPYERAVFCILVISSLGSSPSRSESEEVHGSRAVGKV